MRSLLRAMALIAASPLSGCGDNSSAGPESAAIDCAIEIQIAVVSDWQPKVDLQSGEWQVAADWVFPVQSTGGPGHVVCNTDGALIELDWSDVRTFDNGNVIAFDEFGWRIPNRINRRDGVSQTLGGRDLGSSTSLETDFMPLASCQLDTALDDEARQQSDRQLVVRGRMLPGVPPADPLNLADLAEAP